MKKIVLLLGFIATIFTATAQTEQGESSVLINTGFQTDAKRLLVGAQYRYALFNNIRIAPDAMFFIPKDKVIGLDFNINAHYVIELDYNLTFYPLVGFGMQNNRYMGETINGIKYKAKGNTNFSVNLGAGLGYDISSTSYLNFEAKYMASHKDSFVFAVGYGFSF